MKESSFILCVDGEFLKFTTSIVQDRYADYYGKLAFKRGNRVYHIHRGRRHYVDIPMRQFETGIIDCPMDDGPGTNKRLALVCKSCILRVILPDQNMGESDIVKYFKKQDPSTYSFDKFVSKLP